MCVYHNRHSNNCVFLGNPAKQEAPQEETAFIHSFIRSTVCLSRSKLKGL